MRIESIRQRLRALGALPGHERRVLSLWARALPWDSPPRRPSDHLPRALAAALPAIAAELGALARLRSSHPGADGSERLLLQLGDGQSVESVLLPREGLCVSSQVGCAVGCGFCMFMGMGEPAHNLDNVLEAIDLLGTEGQVGHKNLVFSTVGDARVFERLPAQRVRPALAISLHSTRPELRAQLLPRAPRIDPSELVDLGERYARATGYPIQYQWTLLEGVNDGDDEVERIARLLAGKYAVMNMIPYNAVPGLGYRRPSWERAALIARTLHRRGVLTKLRRSAGQDVDAGCGQLRARALGTPVAIHRA